MKTSISCWWRGFWVASITILLLRFAEAQTGCEVITDCSGSIVVDETSSCDSVIPVEDILLMGTKLLVYVRYDAHALNSVSMHPTELTRLL